MLTSNKKLNIFIIISGIIAGTVFLIVLVGFLFFKFTGGGDIIPGKDMTKLVLSSSNGYDITALYYAPDKNRIMQKLYLKVVKDGVLSTYDMLPAMSASGSKFEDARNDLSFWEHQGEFTFAKGSETICVCYESKEK